jgi:hypothetical protein
MVSVTAVRDAIQSRGIRAITLTFTFSSIRLRVMLKKFPIRAVVYIIRRENLRFAVGQSKSLHAVHTVVDPLMNSVPLMKQRDKSLYHSCPAAFRSSKLNIDHLMYLFKLCMKIQLCTTGGQARRNP